MNAKKAVSRGNGLQIKYEEINEAKITESLTELLKNPKFENNAKIIAKRFKDRPFTPQETVVFWVEYAVRHKGAEFLSATAKDLSFIQLNLLDIYFTILIAFLVILTLAIKITKKIIRVVHTDLNKKKKVI
jgi:glucuronosyltransferase